MEKGPYDQAITCEEKPMNILIFGGGAVGLGLASCLCESGLKPDILARKKTVQALKDQGLFRTGIIGDGHYTDLRAFSDLSDIPGQTLYDLVMVCTKSNDTDDAARILSRYPDLVGASTQLVLCQNGWGNREIFLNYFPSSQVYNARVITGFHRHAPNRVDITVHVQPVTLGSLDHSPCPELLSLRNAIQKGGLSCEITDTIEKDLWAKMLFNCSLNPLGAIFDVPYGELKKSPQTRAIIRDIVHEIFLVLGAAAYTTYWESPDEYYAFLLDTLIPGTARHESSTLQDIRIKKKTEIDALTGALVRLADKNGILVPVNRMLYNMIRFMEGRYLGYD